MNVSCFICNFDQFYPEETKFLLCFSQKSHNSENVSGDTVMLVRIAGKITSLTRCFTSFQRDDLGLQAFPPIVKVWWPEMLFYNITYYYRLQWLNSSPFNNQKNSHVIDQAKPLGTVSHRLTFHIVSSSFINCTPPAVWGPKQKHPSGWQRPWQQVGEEKLRYSRQFDVCGGQVWTCHVGGKCFWNSLCGVSYQTCNWKCEKC